MCRVYGVTRAGYYAWCSRERSEREHQNQALATRIRVVHRDSRGTYGSPRVYQVLRQQGYPAGENRVAQWRAEKPDLAEDEFIDDIPFPETQNYVKKILGTAEDYRHLYGGEAGTVAADTRVATVARPAPASSAKQSSPKKEPAAATKRKTRKAA